MMSPAEPLSLGPTLAPLVQGDIRRAIAMIAERGFRCIQLSATVPLMRPRELDRSARRDLLARLRRHELSISGLDLWIPEEHFGDPAQTDRAMTATLESLDLAAELGRPPLCMRLPPSLDAGLLASIRSRAEIVGVRIANFAFSAPDLGNDRARGVDGASGPIEIEGVIGAGVDPAVTLLSGGDPSQLVSRIADLVAARFSDADRAGRVRPGAGRLDLLEYQVALLTRGYRDPVALDLRHIASPWDAIDAAADAWRSAGPLGAAGI